MTKHGDVLYLGHMLDLARAAHARVRSLTRDEFDRDEDAQIALAHRIQTIGEAARRTSDTLRANHPEIPWSRIIGMRHKVVHDYMHVDPDVVWETANDRLPELIAALERITPPEPPAE